MKNKYFIVQEDFTSKRKSYYKGFDGYLAYEFSNTRNERKVFDNKRHAKKELRELNKNNKKYKDVYGYSIGKISIKK